KIGAGLGSGVCGTNRPGLRHGLFSRLARRTEMLVSKTALAGIAALAGLGFMAFSAPAEAAAGSVSQECSAQYQAAKKAGTLNGQKWTQFYSDCAAKMKADDNSTEDSTAKPKKASKSETSTKK